MIRKFAVLAFLAFVAIGIVSCSKGNPKNTDLVGDKYKKLIVGKWLQVADTTIVFTNNVITSNTPTGLTTDYYQYNADGTAEEFLNGTSTGLITYAVANDQLTLNSPAVSGGGISIPAFSVTITIKKLDATDMVTYSNISVEATFNNVKTTTTTVQTTYFKRQ